jgi:hypothetical protein
MENAPIKTEEQKDCKRSNHHHAHSGAVYFFGFIGAAIYYISAATTFWTGVLGFLKAIVWPALLVLEALKYLGAS